jgi:hypothetical protein
MTGFLRQQFRYLFQTLPMRHSWRDKLWILPEGVYLLVGYVWLLMTLRFGARAAPIAGKTCVAVLDAQSAAKHLLLVEWRCGTGSSQKSLCRTATTGEN